MDYARFLAMWMDGGTALDGQRVLSKEAVARTLTPVSVMTSLGSDTRMPSGFPSLQVYYGEMSLLYVSADAPDTRRPTVIGHSGSDGTWAWAWPDLDVMVLYFTQSRGGLSGIRLETVIDRIIVHPGLEPEIPEKYLPYLGTYITSDNVEFTVLVHNGHLAVDIPILFILELKEPDARGRWYLVLTNDISVSFDRDETGTVTGMRYYEAGAVLRLRKTTTTPVNDWHLFN
jgi:CubicO group peptidase (beta-lactamase class C family)